MIEYPPQDLKNHTRFDPLYHGVLLLTLLANFVFAIFDLVHRHTITAAWFLVLSVVLFIAFAKIRSYPLKVQDRVIRLEERLRLWALAPVELHEHILNLTEDQLIGLRFAPDDEVVALAKQALDEKLNRKQIKERIKNWRPDNFRV